MFANDMRSCNYFEYGEANAYGQPQLGKEYAGTIKIAIYTTNQSTQDNVNYKGANYIGLTLGAVTDKMVIEHGAERLKVQYVQPKGTYKQVFMVKI